MFVDELAPLTALRRLELLLLDDDTLVALVLLASGLRVPGSVLMIASLFILAQMLASCFLRWLGSNDYNYYCVGVIDPAMSTLLNTIKIKIAWSY
jgi:hypothetical protein